MESTAHRTGSGYKGSVGALAQLPWPILPQCETAVAPEQPEALAGPTALKSSDFSDVKLITRPRVSESTLPAAELKCRAIKKINLRKSPNLHTGVGEKGACLQWSHIPSVVSDDLTFFFSIRFLVTPLQHTLRGAPPTE